MVQWKLAVLYSNTLELSLIQAIYFFGYDHRRIFRIANFKSEMEISVPLFTVWFLCGIDATVNSSWGI